MPVVSPVMPSSRSSCCPTVPALRACYWRWRSTRRCVGVGLCSLLVVAVARGQSRKALLSSSCPLLSTLSSCVGAAARVAELGWGWRGAIEDEARTRATKHEQQMDSTGGGDTG